MLSLDGVAVVNEIEEVIDGAVYHFVGPLYSAMMDEQTNRQVLSKVFEYEAALAVQEHIGLNAHIHSNVTLMDGAVCKAELDAVVVHRGGEDVARSSAYIIESALSPQDYDVSKVLDKVELFKKAAPSLPHFRAVDKDKIFPVLAGKNWSVKTLATCKASPLPIWRVSPSGKGYQVHRPLSTMVRQVCKILR
jgi:hypothetical protein